MKYGFRSGPYFRDSPPSRIATASRRIAANALSNEINVGVVFVCWPMLLKVVQERGPVMGQAVFLKIPQWEGKSVVNAHQRRGRLGEAFDEALGNRPTSPIPTRAGRRRNLARFA